MPRHVTQSRLPIKSQLLAASGTQAGRQPGAPAGAAGWAQLLARTRRRLVNQTTSQLDVLGVASALLRPITVT